MTPTQPYSFSPFVIIYGPTGVGKSDLALALAAKNSITIINMDVGQLYEPFGVGTAKPDWKHEVTPHYLFDHLKEPRDYTVVEYRSDVASLLMQSNQQHRIPVAVGGSGFYAVSLLFEHQAHAAHDLRTTYEAQETESLWQELKKVDPERAAVLHPNDRYRIVRALSLWHATHEKPSSKKPLYKPLAPFFLLGVMRDRHELYERINARTESMLAGGWIEEVKNLIDTPWEGFLRKKNLIGYPDVFDYVRGRLSYPDLVRTIQLQTRHYAKRQCSFWRMLENMARKGIEKTGDTVSRVAMVNLTSTPVDSYINQLSDEFVAFKNTRK